MQRIHTTYVRLEQDIQAASLLRLTRNILNKPQTAVMSYVMVNNGFLKRNLNLTEVRNVDSSCVLQVPGLVFEEVNTVDGQVK